MDNPKRYRDVTTEFIDHIEGNANDTVFLTVRAFVSLMIEGEKERPKYKSKRSKANAHRVKVGNAGNDWNTVKDFDADYAKWYALRYERAAKAPEPDVLDALGVDSLDIGKPSNRIEYFEEKSKRK